MQSGSTAPLMFRETLTVHSASRPFAFHRFHARSIAAPPTFPNFPLGSNPFRDPLFDMVARKRTFVTGTETLGVHHQSEMFIIRHVARARTHTHTPHNARARTYTRTRGNFLFSSNHGPRVIARGKMPVRDTFSSPLSILDRHGAARKFSFHIFAPSTSAMDPRRWW